MEQMDPPPTDTHSKNESTYHEGTFLSELLMNSKKHLKIRTTRPDSARPHGPHHHADWLHQAIKEFEHDLRHDALFGTCLQGGLSKEKQMSLAQQLKEKLADLRMTFLEEVNGAAAAESGAEH